MKNLAVAKRYAEALYKEAVEGKAEAALVAELNEFSSLIKSSKEFNILINSASLNAVEQLSVAEALFKSGKLSRLLYAFFVVLIRKRRLNILEAVIAAVARMSHEEKNEAEAEVTYASKVDDSVRREIAERLRKLTGKNILLKEKIDPSLLGGVSVVIGSALYDASIKGQLAAMRALIK